MNNLPLCYDPESMTQQRREEVLKEVYQAIYFWHGTPEAKSYDYPSFMDAVKEWAEDSYLTAALYLQGLPKPGDLVWCFDYPTDPPYHVGNACLYELVEIGERESKLKRPDNGAEVWFRFIAPFEKRNPTKAR